MSYLVVHFKMACGSVTALKLKVTTSMLLVETRTSHSGGCHLNLLRFLEEPISLGFSIADTPLFFSPVYLHETLGNGQIDVCQAIEQSMNILIVDQSSIH